ncbi:MAG: hypothetical protein GY851_34650 [bacterium]|nr:hypothetical protein [bacterium]
MMTVLDRGKYGRYRAACEAGKPETRAWYAVWLPMLLFASVGAVAWAIRGTGGWGGIDGTIVPGMAWALIWYYLAYRRGLDARAVVFWLGMGIALGGELGYGQYVSWIRGNFNVGDEVIPVAPWVGYAWFVLCGIGWGAPGGILLGWALHRRVSLGAWIVRALLFVMLVVFTFNLGAPLLGTGAVEWVGERCVQWCPRFLYPNAGLGIYAGELDDHLGRTVYTNTQNAAVVVWWLAAMVLALFQRDRATLVAGAVIGGGFGIGFLVSALWCLGYVHAPGYIDWWKMWELHAGFNLGVLYMVVFHWITRHVDKHHDPDGTPRAEAYAPHEASVSREWCASAFVAVVGFLLILGASFEYFFWAGLFVGLFYVAAVLIAAAVGAVQRRMGELRAGVLLAFSAYLLIFILLHGGSLGLSVFLELCTASEVDQYAWPANRIALFMPFMTVLTVGTMVHIARLLRSPASAFPSPRLPQRMVDLVTFIGIIGAVSIWPAKIGVLYAVFVCLGVFALTRVNRAWDGVDGGAG